MKFKTRLIIAFFTVIMVPVVLTSLFILLLGRYQISSIEKTYGLTGTTVEVLTNRYRCWDSSPWSLPRTAGGGCGESG